MNRLALAVIVVATVAVALFWYADAQAAKERFEPVITRVDAYAVGPAPHELTLHFTIGMGDVGQGATVTEDAERVRVSVRTLMYVPPRGVFKNLAGLLGRVTVTLREPLAHRVVIDATTNELVRQVLPVSKR